MNKLAAALVSIALVSASAPASAQQWVLGGMLGGGGGVEGGDPGTGSIGFRRARTRVTAQLDARVDEDKSQGFGVVLFAEVEPHAGAGASLRYMRWLSPRFVGFAGFTGAFAPHTLFGGEVGVQAHVPMGEMLSIVIEPSFAVLPLGTDLPDDRVLLWALGTVGVHASF